MNPFAFTGNRPVDIFLPNGSSIAQAKLAAQSIYGAALRALSDYVPNEISQDKSVGSISKMHMIATLDPSISECAYLVVQHVERAGLGHTLACFGKYLQDALSQKLTYFSPFYSAAHDMCNLNETAHFLGLHPAFFWARQPSVNSTVVEVGNLKSKRGCTTFSLAAAVQSFKASHGGSFSCATHGDVVFRCHNEREDFQKRFLRSSAGGWGAVVRTVFRAAQAQGLQSGVTLRDAYVPQEVRNARLAGHMVIVVHLRRGDILQSFRIDRNRLMSFSATLRVIRAILEAKMHISAASAMRERPVSVFFLCEGAMDEHHVVEYSQTAHQIMVQLDLRKTSTFSEPSNCTAATRCSGRTLVGVDAMAALSAMCASDVLLTSPSSFPWVAAVLCEPPVTLAVPASQVSKCILSLMADAALSFTTRLTLFAFLLLLLQTFDGIAGVVPVLAITPLWRSDAEVSVNGTLLKQTMQERLRFYS